MAINWNAPIEIRDGRNGNWFWVDKEVWQDKRLSASDKVTYGTLAYFSNQKTQVSFPSINKLQNYSDVSRRQLYRSIKKLENLKYISIKRKYGKPSQYTLVDDAIRGAKLAPVPNKHQGGAKYGIGGVPNETTNNNYLTRISNKKGKILLRKKLEELKLKKTPSFKIQRPDQHNSL